MDITIDLLALILGISTFAIILNMLSPKFCRYLFVGLGVSLWRSTNTTAKDVIASCVKYGKWEFGTYCRVDMAVFGTQIVVWTIAVMCALAELEHLVGRRWVRGQNKEREVTVVSKE